MQGNVSKGRRQGNERERKGGQAKGRFRMIVWGAQCAQGTFLSPGFGGFLSL